MMRANVMLMYGHIEQSGWIIVHVFRPLTPRWQSYVERELLTSIGRCISIYIYIYMFTNIAEEHTQ